MAVAFELVLFELAAERVAVNSEDVSGAGLISLGVVHHALDEFLLKFREGFIEQNAPIHHLADQGFELILHERILRTASPQGLTRGPVAWKL